METIYWITEYIKVGLLYYVVMFFWPHIVFGKYLKDKSLTFRFGFCVTVQPLLISTVVLSLGLFHLLNPVSMGVLFYGAVLVAAWLKMRSDSSRRRKLRKLLRGTYGFRSLLRNIRNTIRLMLEKHIRAFKKLWQTNSWEMVLVTILVIFGMCYFTHGVFRDHIFGFSDMFVHHSWTYQLTQGNIFSAGVYPEGMHCFVYALHTLFGIRIYSCLLFLPGFHIIVFLLSAYILFKEAFRWKYSGILALALFLMVDSYEAYEIHSMARLQCSLPQEFALYTLFLCAAFLVRYLKGEKTAMILEERKSLKFLKSFWWNDELIVFIFALATSLSVHFYPTIMAFFLCVAFVLPHLIKVFTKGRFKTLVVAVVSGVMIAVIPMAGALASGIPFQGSIGWAIGVIEGKEKEDKLPSSDTETVVMPSDNTGSGEMLTSPGQSTAGELVPGTAVQVQKPSKPSLVSRLLGGVFNKLKTLYNKGYKVLYRGRAAFVVILTLIAFTIWAVGRIVLTIRYRGFDEDGKERSKLDGYLQLVLGAVFFMVIYCAGDLGLPTLIEGNRILAVKRVMVAAVCVIPVDMILVSLDRWGMERIMGIIASAGVLCIYLGTMLTGSFHGFLYYELYNYSGAVSATRYITDNIPKEKFTIVSPVEEIYQLIEYGYHEELIDFVNKSASEDYYLPTEYVFLFVEKHPLLTGQFHFFSGPGWLAQEKYASYFSPSSQCPEIQGYDLSVEMAARPYNGLPNSNWVYQSIEARTILESRLYEWCREFDRLYPNELHTFYEDDTFVCYYFKQNPFQLYNLGLQQ